jgi:putative transcriptional regulator
VTIGQRRFFLDDDHSLSGKVLISMPLLQDPRFTYVVIYVCGHDAHGAMGLIVNKALPTVTFEELLIQMDLVSSNPPREIPIHYGGPVEVRRGFVLHSSDYISDSTVIIENGFAMTATLDILRAIAGDKGPKQSLIALGYVGWGAGQIESEIQDNGWLIMEANQKLVFGDDLEGKWRFALGSLGIDPAGLSFDVGHA